MRRRAAGLSGIFMLTAAVLTLAAAADHAPELHTARFSGSLVREELPAMLRGEGRLRAIQAPPHDLVITWTQAVTVTGHVIGWDSAEIFGAHYGLEAWDDAAGAWRLLYEETANRRERAEHRFPPVTTTRLRFTVFAHPLHYDAVVIRAFRFLPATLPK